MNNRRRRRCSIALASALSLSLIVGNTPALAEESGTADVIIDEAGLEQTHDAEGTSHDDSLSGASEIIIGGRALIFDANGGSGTVDSDKLSRTDEIPACMFAFENKEFAGWNTQADGTGLMVMPGESVGILPEGEDGVPLVLYARWGELQEPAFGDCEPAPTEENTDVASEDGVDELQPMQRVRASVVAYAESNSGGNYGTGTDSMPVIIVATSGSGYMEFFEANNLWPSSYTGTANARYAIWSQVGGQDDLAWRNMSRGTWTRNGITFNVGNAGNILGEHGGADSAIYTHFYVDHNGTSNVLLGAWQYYPRIYITYDLEGGHIGTDESATAVSQQTKYEGQSIALSNADVRITGYTFVGWSPQPAGSEIYAPGQSVGPYDWNAITQMRYNALREVGEERWITSGHAMPASTGAGNTVELHARFRPNEATIVYDGNCATGGYVGDQTLTYDEPASLSSNAYYRNGYHFAGWNTEADGSGVPYAEGEEVLNLATEDGATIRLYAQWEEDVFTVTVPKQISYTEMPVGSVDTSDSYDVTVDGIFTGTITISAEDAGLVNGADSGEGLAADVASADAPLSFTAPGTLADAVSMSGYARSSGNWTGVVNYNCSIEY